MNGTHQHDSDDRDLLIPIDRPVRMPGRIPGRVAASRPGCLLTTLHPERSLSFALVQHLSQEMPDIDFTLDPDAPVDAIWVCGYEQGKAELIAALREEHADSLVLVTGRGALDDWCDEVLDAGADQVCGWPVPYERLSALLRAQRPAAPVRAGASSPRSA